MKRAIALAFILVAAGGCAGSGDSEKASGKAGKTGTGSGDAVVARPVYDPAAHGGVLAGVVSFSGERPGPRSVRMSADPYCDRANSGGAKVARFDVADSGGLAGTVVYISANVPEFEYSLPDETVALDQVNCLYTPRVIAVRAGQGVEIGNADSTLHNVHALPSNSSGFNLGMPRAGMKTVRKFKSPEVFVRFKCDVHPWMQAHVAVLDHPFFAVTDADGRFKIDGIPPGTYQIEAVHPVLGKQTQTVEIKDPQQSPEAPEAGLQIEFTG
jgi:plastocyanin